MNDEKSVVSNMQITAEPTVDSVFTSVFHEGKLYETLPTVSSMGTVQLTVIFPK